VGGHQNGEEGAEFSRSWRGEKCEMSILVFFWGLDVVISAWEVKEVITL
jgi:hypothetical protein